MNTQDNIPVPDATGAIPARKLGHPIAPFIGPANKLTKQQGSKGYRHWCLTLNNPVLTGEEYLDALKKHPDIRYAVLQLEEGDEGTRHFQAYLEFNKQKTLFALKVLEPRGHWEARKGTREQARAYCMKEESRIEGPWELGDWAKGGKGARVDLIKACATVKERGLHALALEDPSVYVKYSRGFEKLSFELRGKRANPPRVILHYGPTGAFKTGLVLHRHPDAYKKPAGTRWFDGYKDQKVLLLDDFAGASSGFRLDYTLQLLDRYDIDVEMKGGHVRLMAEYIYVTTNIHPSAWFNYETRGGQYLALARRFHEVIYFEAFDLKPRRITKDSFFEDWHEGCDEQVIFMDWSVKKEKRGLPRWIQEEQAVIDLCGLSDDEAPPTKRQKVLHRTTTCSDSCEFQRWDDAQTHSSIEGGELSDDDVFVAETQQQEYVDDEIPCSQLRRDLWPEISTDESDSD